MRYFVPNPYVTVGLNSAKINFAFHRFEVDKELNKKKKTENILTCFSPILGHHSIFSCESCYAYCTTISNKRNKVSYLSKTCPQQSATIIFCIECTDYFLGSHGPRFVVAYSLLRFTWSYRERRTSEQEKTTMAPDQSRCSSTVSSRINQCRP